MRRVRLAAIDLGTNSVHMVIANVTPDGRIEVIDRVKEMVRLGKQAFTTGQLSPETMALAGARAEDLRPARPRAAGRAPARGRDQRRARGAQRRALRRRRLRRETGLPIEIISGPEEARLIFRASRHALGLDGGPHLLVDVGGGSVELSLAQDGRPLWMRSLPLGVARLTQQFLTKDPPSAGQVRALERHLEHEMDDLLSRVRRAGAVQAIGTSGTVHTLVAMALAARGDDAPRLHGASATAEQLDAPAPARPVARRRGARRDAGDGRQAGRPHARRRHPARHHPVACRRSRPGRVLVGAARGRAARSRARAGRAGTGVADGAPAQRAVARHALRRHQRARPSGGDARAPALRHARAGPRPAARRRASCSSTPRCCTTSGTPSSTTATSGTPTTSSGRASCSDSRPSRSR